MNIGGLVEADCTVEGVVEMVQDAAQHYTQLQTAKRLSGWHAALSQTGRSGMTRIAVDAGRIAEGGLM